MNLDETRQEGVGGPPRGIESLLRRAAADPEFRRMLLDRRDEAARTFGWTLEPAEAEMLRSVPSEQLDRVIEWAAAAGRSDGALFDEVLRATEEMPASVREEMRVREEVLTLLAGTLGIRPDRRGVDARYFPVVIAPDRSRWRLTFQQRSQCHRQAAIECSFRVGRQNELIPHWRFPNLAIVFSGVNPSLLHGPPQAGKPHERVARITEAVGQRDRQQGRSQERGVVVVCLSAPANLVQVRTEPDASNRIVKQTLPDALVICNRLANLSPLRRLGTQVDLAKLVEEVEQLLTRSCAAPSFDTPAYWGFCRFRGCRLAERSIPVRSAFGIVGLVAHHLTLLSRGHGGHGAHDYSNSVARWLGGTALHRMARRVFLSGKTPDGEYPSSGPFFSGTGSGSVSIPACEGIAMPVFRLPDLTGFRVPCDDPDPLKAAEKKVRDAYRRYQQAAWGAGQAAARLTKALQEIVVLPKGSDVYIPPVEPIDVRNRRLLEEARQADAVAKQRQKEYEKAAETMRNWQNRGNRRRSHERNPGPPRVTRAR